MPSPSSRLTASTDGEIILQYKKLDIWADAVNLAIPWGSAVLIAAFVYLTIGELAGKVTFAQIGVAFLGNLTVSQSLAYIFGGGGILYGMRERRLRHKKTESMAAYSQELEKRWDLNRTSSGLSPSGTTGKEDKR